MKKASGYLQSTAADFVAAFHVPHFLKSTMIAKAPKNDLDLIKQLQEQKLMPGFKDVAQATVFLDTHGTLLTTLLCCLYWMMSSQMMRKLISVRNFGL